MTETPSLLDHASLLARYRDGRSDAEALSAAIHDLMVLTAQLSAALPAISRGLDRGRTLDALRASHRQFLGQSRAGH